MSIPEIEYLGVKTTDELVMDELAKKPLPTCELSRKLGIAHQTIDNCTRRLVQKGLVTRRPAVYRMNGLRRNVVEYSIVKK